MIYNEYGKTGKKVSAISFGGMRFSEPEKYEDMAEIIIRAAEKGINYFDTAPGYCDDHSEKIFNVALKELKRNKLPRYVSTKSAGKDYDKVKERLEKSLKTLDVESIDFFHIWCLMSKDDFIKREKNGAIKAAQEAKEQGLIKHLVCSSHQSGAEAAEVARTGLFEGITIGYNAINFPFREEGIRTAHECGMGTVIMNPLAGGEIIRNEKRFSFLKKDENQPILDAALHFLFAQKHITSALVGFRSVEDVDTAVNAVNSFTPVSETAIEELKKNIQGSFDELCTTCNYCNVCPHEIPVRALMEAYNYYILYENEKEVLDRLKWHWGVKDLSVIDKCTSCNLCVNKCTQKLPILERFGQIKKFAANIT